VGLRARWQSLPHGDPPGCAISALIFDAGQHPPVGPVWPLAKLELGSSLSWSLAGLFFELIGVKLDHLLCGTQNSPTRFH